MCIFPTRFPSEDECTSWLGGHEVRARVYVASSSRVNSSYLLGFGSFFAFEPLVPLLFGPLSPSSLVLYWHQSHSLSLPVLAYLSLPLLSSLRHSSSPLQPRHSSCPSSSSSFPYSASSHPCLGSSPC